MSARRLSRSTKDRKLAGVAGGLGVYFDLDPVAVRVGFVVAAVLGGGLGLLVYLIMWIVVPEEGTGFPDSPMRIAEERYARGEINSEELQRIRRDLRAG